LSRIYGPFGGGGFGLEGLKNLEKLKISCRKMAFIGQFRATLICGIFIAAGLSFMRKAVLPSACSG
jgi:hypothetical protein